MFGGEPFSFSGLGTPSSSWKDGSVIFAFPMPLTSFICYLCETVISLLEWRNVFNVFFTVLMAVYYQRRVLRGQGSKIGRGRHTACLTGVNVVIDGWSWKEKRQADSPR